VTEKATDEQAQPGLTEVAPDARDNRMHAL
jgi:hypothetical protein